LLPAEIAVDDSLTLRRLTQDDANDLFQIIQANPDIKKSVTWPAKVSAIEDVHSGIEEILEECEHRYVLQQDNSTIGYVGMYRSDASESAYGLGYFLDSSARGNGKMSSTLDCLMQTVKESVPVDMFVAYIIDSNKPSQSVVSRLGFTVTDVLLEDKALQAMIRRWERPLDE
jgi:ribosomal-protein-serine acetyltransferase